jgi:hypothetical protein
MARAFESGVNAAADETKIPSPVFEAAGVMSFEEAMTSPAEWEGEGRTV